MKADILEFIGGGIAPKNEIIKITNALAFNICFEAKAKTGEVRYYLKAINLNPVKKTMVGCDGHMIFICDAVDFSGYASKKELNIIPSKKLPKNAVNIEINLQTNMITANKNNLGGDQIIIPFSLCDAKYPDFDKVLKKDINKDFKANDLSFNPNLFYRLIKNIARFDHPVKIKGVSDDGAIFVDIFGINNEEFDYDAIVMRVRA